MFEFPGFSFDRERHQYTLNGVGLPSLSNILNESLNIFYQSNLEAMERGSRIHRALELWDKKDLDESSINDTLRAYIAGWEKFKKKFKLDSFDIIENPMPSLKYKFACTPDRFSLSKLMLIEIKTGIETIAWPLQLAAQLICIKPIFSLSTAKKITRVSVIVRENDFDVKSHCKSTDENIFLNCFNVFKYKKGLI